jgi:hypothetical protein
MASSPAKVTWDTSPHNKLLWARSAYESHPLLCVNQTTSCLNIWKDTFKVLGVYKLICLTTARPYACYYSHYHFLHIFGDN